MRWGFPLLAASLLLFPACALDKHCGTGTSECGGACVDTRADAAHCGACGNVCPSGSCVGGACPFLPCRGDEVVCLGADSGVVTGPGGSVTKWTDQSPNHYDATTVSSGGPVLATAVVNGKTVPVSEYERAYGGKDELSVTEIPFFYPRNFMGKGVALRNLKEVVEGLPLPNLEDPADLLTPERVILEDPARWAGQPLPQGFGWFPRTWYPRSAYVGAFPPFVDVETVTREEQLGLLPRNHVALAKQFKLPGMDVRFHNGASIGLRMDRLKGNERITLRGLTPDGLLDFSLPGETPAVSLDIGQGARQLEMKLDTVAVRPDDMEADLLWRAGLPYPGFSWIPRMTKLEAVVA